MKNQIQCPECESYNIKTIGAEVIWGGVITMIIIGPALWRVNGILFGAIVLMIGIVQKKFTNKFVCKKCKYKFKHEIITKRA